MKLFWSVAQKGGKFTGLNARKLQKKGLKLDKIKQMANEAKSKGELKSSIY